MPRITEVYSNNPADCLWCHIPLLEWQQKKTFQSLSCQEGQNMKIVLHPLSVSSMGNRCLPFLPTVGYAPYNTMAHGRECCFCWQREGLIFFYLHGCSSGWIVFLLYWGPQFWVPECDSSWQHLPYHCDGCCMYWNHYARLTPTLSQQWQV
jgi:hypothetical protein